MKKVNKLFVIALISIAITGIQGCAKIFTTGELVGTWTVTGDNSSGNSKEVFVNDTGIPGETIINEREWTNSYNGTTQTSTNTQTETKDDEVAGGVKTIVTKTVKSANSTLATTTYNFADSVYMDTLFFDEDVTENVKLTYTFKNDGTFTASKVYSVKNIDILIDDTIQKSTKTTELSDNATYSGTWSYIGENKGDDLLDKQRVGLWYKSATGSSNSKVISKIVDNDPNDFNDYTFNNTKTTKVDISEKFEQSTPAEVWELVSKSNKTMEIEFLKSVSTKDSKTVTTDSDTPNVSISTVIDRNSNSNGKRTMTKE